MYLKCCDGHVLTVELHILIVLYCIGKYLNVKRKEYSSAGIRLLDKPRG